MASSAAAQAGTAAKALVRARLSSAALVIGANRYGGCCSAPLQEVGHSECRQHLPTTLSLPSRVLAILPHVPHLDSREGRCLFLVLLAIAGIFWRTRPASH
jgi:hypothetical protein